MSLANKPTVTFATDGTDTVGGGVTFIVVQGQGGGELSCYARFAQRTPAIPRNLARTMPRIYPPARTKRLPANLSPGRITASRADAAGLAGHRCNFRTGWTPAPANEPRYRLCVKRDGQGYGGLRWQMPILQVTVEISVAVTNRLITVTVDRRRVWLTGEHYHLSLTCGVKQPCHRRHFYVPRAVRVHTRASLCKALAADKIPSINIVAGDGSGSIALMDGAQRFSRTEQRGKDSQPSSLSIPPPDICQVGTKLQIVIPAGWTAPLSPKQRQGRLIAGETQHYPHRQGDTGACRPGRS